MAVKTLNPKQDGPANRYISKVRYYLDEKPKSSVYKDVRATEQNPTSLFSQEAWGSFSVPFTIFMNPRTHSKSGL